MEFKDKIKKLRTDAHMTMDELAKSIGVSAPTIQRYESGEIKNVRHDKINALANALNTTPEFLIGTSDALPIGERIKSRRNELGITLLEVAECLGVAEATAQRYESGTIKQIPYNKIILYAALLECTPTYLMDWDGPEIENQKELQIIADIYLSLDIKRRKTAIKILEVLKDEQG